MNKSLYWIVVALVGALGGCLSGMFAIGGGIVLVPLLVMIAKFDQRRAAATSLAAIIPSAIAGCATYVLNDEINWSAASFITVGAVFGAIIGTALLKRLPLKWLQWLFVVLIAGAALQLLMDIPERHGEVTTGLPMIVGYITLGLFMGVGSGLLGIGGGIIAVPALIAIFEFGDLVAKGTSLAVVVPTAIVGTLMNRRNRLVHLRTGMVVGVAAACAAVPGALMALQMSPKLSAYLFAALLAAVGINTVRKALRRKEEAAPAVS